MRPTGRSGPTRKGEEHDDYSLREIAEAYWQHAAEWDGRWLDDLAILASDDGYRIGSARMRTADERVVITWDGVEALGCDGPDDLARHLEACEPSPWWMIDD